jgi:hypothetical protein
MAPGVSFFDFLKNVNKWIERSWDSLAICFFAVDVIKYLAT